MILSYHKEEEIAKNLVITLEEGQLEQVKSQLTERTGARLEALDADFLGKNGEIRTIYPATGNTHRMILLGLGKSPDTQSVQKAAFSLVKKLGKKVQGAVWLDLVRFSWIKDQENIPELAEAFARGAQLGAYDIGLFKTEEGSPEREALKLVEIGFLAEESLLASIKLAAWRGRETAVTQRKIMDLVNLPGNKLFPEDFAQKAIDSGRACGFDVTVMDKAAIEAEGMGALLGVNQGSAKPPVFIVMEYKGKGENLKKVALVGKGVTFDTGGISIKPSASMYYMKSDMGGAAAVFGTMELAAKFELPIHLIGIIPATDNKLGADAIVPGDILHSYSGITIEVEDTDAEGRLILADGLSWVIQNHAPDVVIDLATLTGACVFALGYHAAGLFTQNDELAAALTAAGQTSRERVWRLPLWDDYAPQLHSDVADIKNYGGRPAGAVTAAKFLEKFTHKHAAWAHLDIAGVAFGDAGQGKGKTGTGFGPKLLLTYLEQLIDNQ